jgi:hypothetical protein
MLNRQEGESNVQVALEIAFLDAKPNQTKSAAGKLATCQSSTRTL